MPLPLVWSEREDGDWEACVIAAYAMGLLYGGLAIAGAYSQAEREALEATPDEPQDLNTTDVRSLARYGVQLRKLSTGSIADAVTRVGVGLVLTGYGGMLIPTTAPLHEAFYVPATEIDGWWFDPLATDRSSPVRIAASRVVAWSKGAGPNDAREVREGEFAPVVDVTIIRRDYFAVRTITTKGGDLTGYRLDPLPLTVTGTFDPGSPAPASAEYVITPTPAGWPEGPLYQLIAAGPLDGYLVANAQVNLGPEPAPPAVPAVDLTATARAAVRAALLDAAAALED